MRTKSLDVSYDKRMKLVATNYSYCLFKKRVTTSKEEDEICTLYIARVNKALESLDNVQKYFLNNSYFNNKDKFWWVPLYSKTTYYRIRNDALKVFLTTFECLAKH